MRVCVLIAASLEGRKRIKLGGKRECKSRERPVIAVKERESEKRDRERKREKYLTTATATCTGLRPGYGNLSVSN